MTLRLQQRIKAPPIRIDELTSESRTVPSGTFQSVEDVQPREEENPVRSYGDSSRFRLRFLLPVEIHPAQLMMWWQCGLLLSPLKTRNATQSVCVLNETKIPVMNAHAT